MGILDRFSLDDRKALVTGGGSGIGQSIALALAEAGADVAVAYRNIAGADMLGDPVVGGIGAFRHDDAIDALVAAFDCLERSHNQARPRTLDIDPRM